MRGFAEPLPIDDVLPEVARALAEGNRAVLVAPPGAGKTTRAPLALLDEPFARAGKILVLEPRRLAARAAAGRMAATLGERVGETIGLRVRMQSLVSSATRVEVVTEGVFARMIVGDPELKGIAAVLFDEFHERSLDADLGLALALDAQAALREDLRIVVMSATLDGARVARLMQGAVQIESTGRAFPVETRYVGRDLKLRTEDQVVRAVLEALVAERGSILVFLPGQGEITRVAAALGERLRDPKVDIAPLYGALDVRTQDRAVAPAAPGRRKIVLATSIAETSLTIEGVRVVVDSGLMRVPRFEPGLGLTRLETVRVSRANADQRRGRAGRVEPGVCYRLWDEAADGGLQPYATPEILSADLSGFALDLALWGVADPSALPFLDPPPRAAITEARALLGRLGALDSGGQVTDEGRAMARLAVPPRLARMLVDAGREGAGALAAEIATLIGERGLGGTAVDLGARLEGFRRDRSPRAEDARRLAQRLARQVGDVKAGDLEAAAPGVWLARAFPDRVAMARGKPGEFLMANGRAASVEPHDALAREAFLAVGEVSGRAGAARIGLAAPMSAQEVEAVAGASLETADELTFDKAAAALRRRRRKRFGALTLGQQTLPVTADEASARALAEGVLSLGVERLPWTKALTQWRGRVAFLRRADPEGWPDLSDAALAAPDWLTPFVEGKTSLADIGADDCEAALKAPFDYAALQKLDREAPTHFLAPTGNAFAVDYEAEGGPAVALRVQEVYGLTQHPALAGGRVALTLHLLSPAHRPIQITRDLPGFWRGSWASVRADLRGRYPRHLWPENPAEAMATARAKPRGT